MRFWIDGLVQFGRPSRFDECSGIIAGEQIKILVGRCASRRSSQSGNAMELVKIFFFLLLALSGTFAEAADVNGRATVGGYIAKERFTGVSGEDAANDAALLSLRLLLDASNIGTSGYRLVLDVRDKNDFFDKLDKERLELTTKNTLQLRQAYVQYPNDSGRFYGTLGRFSAFDSGVVYADGAEVGFRASNKFRLGAFGGLSPKYDATEDFSGLGTGQLLGGFGIYQTGAQNWFQYTYSSTAVVSMKADPLPVEDGVLADTGSGYAAGAYSRSFIYNNSILQFSRDMRFMSLAYLDIQPEAKLQNLWLSLFRRLTQSLSLNLSGSSIEASEYRKTQDVREKLDPSAYMQAKSEFNYRVADSISLVGNLVYGQRDADSLKRSEVSLGAIFANLANNRYSANLLGGVRKNFTNNDTFFRGGLGRYSRVVEATIDYEYATETDQNKKKLHPTRLEVGLGTILSNRFFTTIAVQQRKDEVVNIISGVFRVATRFGNKQIPPVRDGAPVRGRL